MGSINLPASIFQRADMQQIFFQKSFVIWYSPISQYKCWFRTTTTINSQTQSPQKANQFSSIQLPYNTTSTTLTTSTQQQSTDNADGRRQQKFHDNKKHFSRNSFSRSSSIFWTTVDEFFNSRHHQRHFRDTDESITSRSAFYWRQNSIQRFQKNHQQLKWEIQFGYTDEITEQKRTKDDKERLQTGFNSNRSTANFLIFSAQKWGPSLPGEARAKYCNIKKTKSSCWLYNCTSMIRKWITFLG